MNKCLVCDCCLKTIDAHYLRYSKHPMFDPKNCIKYSTTIILMFIFIYMKQLSLSSYMAVRKTLHIKAEQALLDGVYTEI